MGISGWRRRLEGARPFSSPYLFEENDTLWGKINHSLQVFLAEEVLVDGRLTKETLEESKLLRNMHVVGDGVEALVRIMRQVELMLMRFLNNVNRWNPRCSIRQGVSVWS